VSNSTSGREDGTRKTGRTPVAQRRCSPPEVAQRLPTCPVRPAYPEVDSSVVGRSAPSASFSSVTRLLSPWLVLTLKQKWPDFCGIVGRREWSRFGVSDPVSSLSCFCCGGESQLGKTLNDRFLKRMAFPEAYQSARRFPSIHETGANGVTTESGVWRARGRDLGAPGLRERATAGPSRRM
jgi:hypothetical protein